MRNSKSASYALYDEFDCRTSAGEACVIRTAQSQLRVGLAMLTLLIGTMCSAYGQNWLDTVKAAEAEGTVAVIGPPIPTHRATIERFKQAFPKINLQLSGMGPSEYEPRLEAERKAGIYAWDVMISGMGPSTYLVYIPQNWTDALTRGINTEMWSE